MSSIPRLSYGYRAAWDNHIGHYESLWENTSYSWKVDWHIVERFIEVRMTKIVKAPLLY